MGKLIDRERQRQARAARVARKQRIIEVADACFVELPPGDVTLDLIGRRADVEAGMVSMYFGSREELFFAVLRTRLGEWRQDVEARLGGSEGDEAGPATVVATGLAARPALLRLLGLAPPLLESCGDMTSVLGFARWYHLQVQAVGVAVAGRGGVTETTATRAVHRALVMAGGLGFAALPRGAGVLIQDGLGDLDVAMEAELERLLESYLGWGD